LSSFREQTGPVQQGRITGQRFIVSNTIERAIQIASQKYPAGEWHSMLPRQRTKAIYEALRQLDAEALAASRSTPDTPPRRKRKRQMAPA
jgi:hypothetical protein